jgi:hypothetical protein
MNNYKIEREAIALSGTGTAQIVLRLKTDDGQYRQYSYILSETDNNEQIADLEANAEKLMASTLRK